MRARTTEVKSSASSCMKMWGSKIPVLGKTWLRAGRSEGHSRKGWVMEEGEKQRR
jgi:hypothetical protein